VVGGGGPVSLAGLGSPREEARALTTQLQSFVITVVPNIKNIPNSQEVSCFMIFYLEWI
jgi:hypothetical protein